MNADSAARDFGARTRELTQGVLQAARSAGVNRLLQVSALKAAPDAPSYYLRTKGDAEQLDPRKRRRARLDHIPAVGDVRSRRFVLEPLCRFARDHSLGAAAGKAECALSAGLGGRRDRGHAALSARRRLQPSNL